MRGVYTATIEVSGVNSQKTMLLLMLPNVCVAEIMEANLTNASVDTNEQLSAGLFRVTGGAASGTLLTPALKETLDSSPRAQVLGNLTTEPTYNFTSPLDKRAFPNLAGYYYEPLQEMHDIIPPSGIVGLKLIDAPTSPLDIKAEITWREIG